VGSGEKEEKSRGRGLKMLSRDTTSQRKRKSFIKHECLRWRKDEVHGGTYHVVTGGGLKGVRSAFSKWMTGKGREEQWKACNASRPKESETNFCRFPEMPLF